MPANHAVRRLRWPRRREGDDEHKECWPEEGGGCQCGTAQEVGADDRTGRHDREPGKADRRRK